MNLYSTTNRAFFALIVVGALGTAGCASKTAATDPAAAEQAKKANYEIIKSGDTDGRLEVVSVASGKPGDTAKASVEVRNKSNFSWKFEYRFKWYDASGMEIGVDSTAWTPVAIMANETKSLQSLAPNPTAATFKLFLQEKP